jgi:hypothetical protein
MSDEPNVIFICTDPDAYDADELAECSTLSGGDLMASFHRAAEKSLRDSKLFDAFEIKTIGQNEGGLATFYSTRWAYEDSGVATHFSLTKQQRDALHDADRLGWEAMHAALNAHPDLEWFKEMKLDPPVTR